MSFAIVGFILIYPLLLIIALWLIPKVVEHKYIRRIIFIVWFLIPTWDVIIGYPIYKFLCATQAGVKIYKTVDNVEGFYVGEDIGTYSKIPPMPYKGYKYIEYKKRENQKQPFKYYRVSWVDINSTDGCIQLGSVYKEKYADVLNQGKCIVKEEIAEGEVSRWEVNNSYWTNQKALIPVLSFKKDELVYIKDRRDNKKVGQIIDYWWKNGWLVGYVLTGWSVDFEPQGVHCIYDPYKHQEIEKQFLFQTLKPKK